MLAEIRTRLKHRAITAALKTQASYRAGLRSDVRALWTGTWDQGDFFEGMALTIERGFTQAWEEGMLMAGMVIEDMTPEERMALRQMINAEMMFVLPFGADIDAGSKANGGKLQPFLDRVELWVARYLNVRNQALAMAKSDPTLEWVTNALESCDSCLKLSGKRKRASVWAKAGIRPQHPDLLDCMISAGGVDVCQCTFVPTADPSTRGRLPKLP